MSNQNQQILRNAYSIRSHTNYANSNLDMRNFNTFRNKGQSYFMSSGDFKFSNINVPLDNEMSIQNYVQPIIINEFQPKIVYYLFGNLLDLGDDVITAIFGDFAPRTLLNLVKDGGKNAAQAINTATIDKQIDNMSAHPEKYFGKNGENNKYIRYIKKLFNSGIWLNTYELPFFKETYLESDGAKYWQVNNIQQIYGKNLGEFKQSTLSMDVPSFPSFKIPNIGDTGYSDESLGFSFYLINENDGDIVKNFKFLTAFFSGTEWIHEESGYTLGTNVYNLNIPGRFQIFWAALSMEITHCGKLRKYPGVGGKLAEQGGGDDYKKYNDYLWPEAWLLNIHVHNLTVNNFNTYVDNLLYGFEHTTYTSISTTNTINTNPGVYDKSKIPKPPPPKPKPKPKPKSKREMSAAEVSMSMPL